ncbi:hypothetical protein [Aquabacterium sp.]|uniref:hypothetical protein n=1 Tax=Aquabacterium sp. TaxID=1872578 RepID=UPI002D160497|nr:hypothetical protein [Aquabacterium sp.]HSW06206.1 hypothetical protein [Aquabacterium sp.]
MRRITAWQSHPEATSPVATHGHAVRGNRRRLVVFGVVFGLCLMAGLTWDLARPPVYRASARLQIDLPGHAPAGASATTGGPTSWGADFLSQVQVIDSGPLLTQLARRLAEEGVPLDTAGSDPVAVLQDMIAVHPVAGTEVVELQATGSTPRVLAPALNRLMALYSEHVLTSYRQSNEQRGAGLRDELGRLEKSAEERRRQLDRFRGRAGIVTTERDENEAVARSRGLSTALNSALEKQAAADARVDSLLQGAAGAAGTTRSRDDPTLAAQESRISQLREEIREMERSFTADFMAMDPRARALRARLAELERQVAQQRIDNRDSNLAKAREEAAGARAAVERLREQLQGERQGLRSASTGYAQSKLLEDDLAQIERARRDTLERLTRLEAEERSRAPRVSVLDPAVPPTQPFRPDYWRDGALVLAGSLLLALGVMGVVEVFNREPAMSVASPAALVLPQAWPVLSRPMDTSAAALPPPGQALLAAPSPRELDQPEAAALLAAAQGQARWACAAALLGLAAQELVALRRADLDGTSGSLQVSGGSARRVTLPRWLQAELEAEPAEPLGFVLHDATGQPLRIEDLAAMVSGAAVDAGIDRAAEVTPQVLRHTCIGWLISQGLRFAELPAQVGRVNAQTVADFASRAQHLPRRNADEIELMMPALSMDPRG